MRLASSFLVGASLFGSPLRGYGPRGASPRPSPVDPWEPTRSHADCRLAGRLTLCGATSGRGAVRGPLRRHRPPALRGGLLGRRTGVAQVRASSDRPIGGLCHRLRDMYVCFFSFHGLSELGSQVPSAYELAREHSRPGTRSARACPCLFALASRAACTCAAATQRRAAHSGPVAQALRLHRPGRRVIECMFAYFFVLRCSSIYGALDCRNLSTPLYSALYLFCIFLVISG